MNSRVSGILELGLLWLEQINSQFRKKWKYLFPYQCSDSCTEVNDITLLGGWIISAQGYFTKNTDLFPGKIRKSLKECPMKAVVRDGHWYFITNYVF